MKVYHYNPITKEFSGITEAKIDPLESKIQERFIYLLPAYATFDEAPACDTDRVAIYNGSEWEIVDKPEEIKPDPVNPTPEEIEAAEIEFLIASEIRRLAINSLISEGKLTEAGKLATIKEGEK